MKLKDELVELEARRAAFMTMLHDPGISEQQRTVWMRRLDEVLAAQALISADMKADPIGYLAWLWADDAESVQQLARRFPQ